MNKEFLDYYNVLLNDINSLDTTTLEKIMCCTKNILSKAEVALSKANKCHKIVVKKKKDDTATLIDVLDSPSSVKSYLSTLNYKRQGDNKPGISLFGDDPYVYNNASRNLNPVPISSSPIIENALKIINEKTGHEYNSVLVNCYHNKNTFLTWHKDDEKEIDKSVPITTLSIGAQRRLVFSTDEGKSKKIEETVVLKSNSAFTMNLRLQDEYYHQLCAGRSSIKAECGKRYSLTFRRIIPSQFPPLTQPLPTQKTVPSQPTPPLATVQTKNSTPLQRYDALVYGSSLTKGLKENLLSQRGKTFKVYPHGGAHVSDIISDIKKTKGSNNIDTDAVSNLFLMCGGNDIENMYTDEDLYTLCSFYEHLLKTAKDVFPNARINLISLIPRRSRYINHWDRVFWINSELISICKQMNARFLSIFSHFMDNKSGSMNINLYNRDEVHLNSKGSSVLGKVLIGVANFPWV